MEFTWNLGKNTKLKEERGVSFEEVKDCLEKGAFRTIKSSSGNHTRQNWYIVRLRGRLWAVPFSKQGIRIHLLTIMRYP